MAQSDAIVQLNYNNNNGSSSSHNNMKKKQRRRTAIIFKPACLGSILLLMYVIFVYLILITFEEDSPHVDSNSNGNDKGASRRQISSTNSNNSYGAPSPSRQPIKSSSKQQEEESPLDLQQQQQQEQAKLVQFNKDHPDLINFCGECIWKDTLYTCNERIKYEVEHSKSTSEIDAMHSNLIYCTKPHELHVSEFCGECQWKDLDDVTCNERVAWEVEHKKLPSIEAKRRNLEYCKRPPYVLSPICGGCNHILSNVTSKMYRSGVPCHDHMIRRVKKGTSKDMVDAGQIVAEEYPECKLCHPKHCWKEYFTDLSMSVTGLDEDNKGYLTKYWRFDRAAPKILNPTTLVLPSIPKEFRIPPSRFHDIESFLTEKFNAFEHSNDTKHVEIFIEYNPGLAHVPNKMKKYLPSNAAYVVAFRVTPANNCFRRDQMKELPQKVWDHTMMSATNLLGLALLDTSYNMLQGYDIVVDIATQLGFQKDGYGTTYFGEPTFMDYRLFTLNDELYLHANADVTVVTKLDLRSKEFGRKAQKGEFKIDIVYGQNNLEMILLHQFNAIWSGGDRGKNFALFSIPNSTHPNEPDSTYAEVEINNPYHQVQQLYLDEYEKIPRKIVKKRIRRNWTVDPIMMRRVKSNGNLTDSDKEEPSPSFYTVDEHFFPGIRPAFRRGGHGGACCVSLSRDEVLAQGDHIKLAHNSWGENDYLLVGVAHTSVIWRRWYSDKHVPDSEKSMIPHTHYVSFFYAFEPRPPFNLRARSGYFCLGFAGEDGTEGGAFNPHSILTVNRKLSQHNETFSCPQIHFVSSFVEKVGDSSSSVIGYGINDCTPRIVEVEKKEIARMLFSDPFEMKIESKSSHEMMEDLKPPAWLKAWQ